MAAAACKEGMNGHLFDGRPCLVALASPDTIRRMGGDQMNKNQQVMAQSQLPALTQKSRGSSNFGRGGGGGGDGGNWERGDGTGNRGSMGNMRNRMGTVNGRGIVGNGGIVSLQVPSFPPVVVPHINPTFFGQGLAPGGNGMWSDPNMAGWGGEEQSSNGEDATSDRQHEKGAMGIIGWLKGTIMVLQREGVKRRKMRVLDRTAACDNAGFLKLIHGPRINGSGPSKACWIVARRDTMEIFDYRKNFSTVT
ncbi:unnamed protein product [Musa textilis]